MTLRIFMLLILSTKVSGVSCSENFLASWKPAIHAAKGISSILLTPALLFRAKWRNVHLIQQGRLEVANEAMSSVVSSIPLGLQTVQIMNLAKIIDEVMESHYESEKTKAGLIDAKISAGQFIRWHAYRRYIKAVQKARVCTRFSNCDEYGASRFITHIYRKRLKWGIRHERPIALEVTRTEYAHRLLVIDQEYVCDHNEFQRDQIGPNLDLYHPMLFEWSTDKFNQKMNEYNHRKKINELTRDLRRLYLEVDARKLRNTYERTPVVLSARQLETSGF